MRSILIIINLTFILISNTILAKDIPVIVIAPGKTVQSLSTVGTNVTVISGEEIRNSNENFLGNIIDKTSTSTNLFQMGGDGTNMGVQLRGLEKRYSTVYIDGIKMSDPASPDNSFYFQNISKDSIEKVEILKGNQSSLYGANAIGGTIHIFTRKGKEGHKKNTEIKTGSNNSKGIHQSIEGANDKIDYYVGLNRYLTDGISARNDDGESDQYRNEGLHTNFGIKLNDDFEVRNTIRYVNTDFKFDAVNSSSTDVNNRSDDIEGSFSLKLIHEKKNIGNTISYNKTYIERKTTDSSSDQQDYFGFRDAINWTGSYNFDLDNRLVYGAEAEFDAARYTGDYAPSARGYAKTLKDKAADEHIFSQFFDYQFRPIENLYSTLGLRNDEHSTAGNKISGRSTLAFKLNNNSIIRSSYGSGVKFPSLYDVHYANGNTNVSGGGLESGDGWQGLTAQDIHAERANSFDLGYETFVDNYDLGLNLSYFNIIQKNSLAGDNRNNWKIQNTSGDNTSEGLEFGLNWKPRDKKYGINFDYTFTESYDNNNCHQELTSGCNIKSSKLGDAKVRVPRNTFASKITHNTSPKLSNAVLIKFVDERRDFGDANNSFTDVILEDYTTVDFLSNFNLFDGYNLSFSANNIFNDIYEQAHGYSGKGRSFNISLKRVY